MFTAGFIFTQRVESLLLLRFYDKTVESKLFWNRISSAPSLKLPTKYHNSEICLPVKYLYTSVKWRTSEFKCFRMRYKISMPLSHFCWGCSEIHNGFKVLKFCIQKVQTSQKIYKVLYLPAYCTVVGTVWQAIIPQNSGVSINQRSAATKVNFEVKARYLKGYQVFQLFFKPGPFIFRIFNCLLFMRKTKWYA